MVHNLTKYWAFTWDTNVLQKQLPKIIDLKVFLDHLSSTAIFQEEKGTVSSKIHYQGCFTLLGPRGSTRSVLKAFEARFKNVSGLTLSPVYDKNAILRYTTKSETRVSGPYYCGSEELHNVEYQTMDLRPWQRDLYNLLLNVKHERHPDFKKFRDRYIIWVSDPVGGSGKSEFIKWLRSGQKELTARKLPIDSVDRLISSVVNITQKEKIDLFVIDDTRTKGKDTSFNDMFESIETIKNGHAVSCMYGRYSESLFRRPLLVFFTNRNLDDFTNCLSQDRWYSMKIEHNQLLDRSKPAKDWFEAYSEKE